MNGSVSIKDSSCSNPVPHGFIFLLPNTEVYYVLSHQYSNGINIDNMKSKLDLAPQLLNNSVYSYTPIHTTSDKVRER